MKKIFAVCVTLFLLLTSVFVGEIGAAAEGEDSYIDISGARLVYFIGDAFDYGNIKVVYNGFEIPSEDLTAEGFSSAAAGSRTVKLSYGNMSVSYSVSVYQRVKEIRLISVTHKTSYFTGEKISVADMKIQLVYENGETKNINVEDKWIKGFDSSEPADTQTLTIDFGGITAAFDVEIKAIGLPDKNYEQIPLSGENADALQRAENSAGKTALIAVWAAGLAALSGCVVFAVVKYVRRGNK